MPSEFRARNPLPFAEKQNPDSCQGFGPALFILHRQTKPSSLVADTLACVLNQLCGTALPRALASFMPDLVRSAIGARPPARKTSPAASTSRWAALGLKCAPASVSWSMMSRRGLTERAGRAEPRRAFRRRRPNAALRGQGRHGRHRGAALRDGQVAACGSLLHLLHFCRLVVGGHACVTNHPATRSRCHRGRFPVRSSSRMGLI